MSLKLNLGCGPVQPPGWTNVDGSKRAWLASRLPWVDRALAALRVLPPTEFNSRTFFARLERDWPWKDGSADAIYAGEILEHFTQEAGRRVVRECHRVLKPGGIVRIRVPDNVQLWENYLNEFRRMKALPRSQWSLDHTKWIEMFFQDICVRPKLLRSATHYHKWMYDEISLIRTLEEAGFEQAERMPFRTSRIEDVAGVEVRDCGFAVEAVKPER